MICQFEFHNHNEIRPTTFGSYSLTILYFIEICPVVSDIKLETERQGLLVMCPCYALCERTF